MTNKTLKIISDEMESLDLNYAFMEFNDEPEYPYFVGEYQENEPMNEDGMNESTFIITGFSRGEWLHLEDAKALIREHFNEISGLVTSVENLNVAIFYANAFPVPTGDAELKKIQINLKIKEWKVN